MTQTLERKERHEKERIGSTVEAARRMAGNNLESADGRARRIGILPGTRLKYEEFLFQCRKV